jgi:hypothetical protein
MMRRCTASLIVLTSFLVATLPTTAWAAQWVRNPERPDQWIDLASRKHDDEIVRFDVSLGTDSERGTASTSPDDVAIELLNCVSGKRVLMLPMLDNQTRHLPDLPEGDALRTLVCG